MMNKWLEKLVLVRNPLLSCQRRFLDFIKKFTLILKLNDVREKKRETLFFLILLHLA